MFNFFHKRKQSNDIEQSKMKIKLLRPYLDLAKLITYDSYYKDTITYEDVSIDIHLSDLYNSVCDIIVSYKEIEVIKLYLTTGGLHFSDDFIPYNKTTIAYEPCDKIIEEINHAISIANAKCIQMINDIHQTRRNKKEDEIEEKKKYNEKARKILGCK